MADGTAQILLKRKYQALRQKCQRIFSLSMQNTTSQTLTANILDNKSGFTGANAITGYSQDEINSWVSDGANFMTSAVYDEVNEQMVVVRSDTSGNNNLFYRVNNSTNVATLTATRPVGIPSWSNELVNLYHPFDDYFYFVYTTSSTGGVRIEGVPNSLSGVGTSANVSTIASNIEDVQIDPNGRIFVLDNTNDTIWEVNLPLSGAGTSRPTGTTLTQTLVYIPSTDEIWFHADDNLYAMELTGYTVSTIYTGNSNFNASQMVVVGNEVWSIQYSLTTPTLVKWNISTKTITYQKVLDGSPTGLTNKVAFNIDDRNNIYLRSNSYGYYVYDSNGNFLTTYKISDRTVTGGGNGIMNLGNKQDYQLPTQTYNPKNGKLYISGAIQTLYATSFSYSGGLSGLTLTTSSSDYQMAVTEFNTMPILVTHLLVYYNNGGTSLNNVIKYFNETSTGGCDRRIIQPRKYISAMDSSDKVVEIDFCDRPLVIDSAHYLKLDIPSNETITMLFYYKQAEKKDLLLSKILG